MSTNLKISEKENVTPGLSPAKASYPLRGAVGSIIERYDRIDQEYPEVLNGPVSYQNLVMIMLYYLEGMSFREIANVLPKYVECPSASYVARDTIRRRYQAEKGWPLFQTTFPEVAAELEGIRKDVLEKEMAKALVIKDDDDVSTSEEESSMDKTSPKGKNVAKELDMNMIVRPAGMPIIRREKTKFKRVMSGYTYILGFLPRKDIEASFLKNQMTPDGFLLCPIPKSALPHRKSSAFQGLYREKEMSDRDYHFKITKPPTTGRAIDRYAQFVTMKHTVMPTFDFWFVADADPKHINAFIPNKKTLRATKLKWTLRDQIEVYVVASSFGNAHVCDVIMDDWLANHKTMGNDGSTPVEFATDIKYLLDNTMEGHPAQRFFADLLTKARLTIVFSKTTNSAMISTDNDLTFTQSEPAAVRLRTTNEKASCERFHLHNRANADCHRNEFQTPGSLPTFDPELGVFDDALWAELGAYKRKKKAAWDGGIRGKSFFDEWENLRFLKLEKLLKRYSAHYREVDLAWSGDGARWAQMDEDRSVWVMPVEMGEVAGVVSQV